MVYKLEIVDKDELKKIRYIGDGTVRDKLLSIDLFRDLANTLMEKNPKLTYDVAYLEAKQMTSSENHYQDINSNQEENLGGETQNYTKAKVKVYTMNNGGIPNMYGEDDAA